MCGVVGFWTHDTERFRRAEATIDRMCDAIRHRGPDAAGRWTDAKAGVALGHRRLSIIDLSPAGRQPMVSADGDHVLVYNGEVYNFEAIRSELVAETPVDFRGDSDTEVVLEAIAHWGLRPTLDRMVGMFAFAHFDRSRRRLHLVRDRLGIKPMYWGRVDASFVFGSELAALERVDGFDRRIDRMALALLLKRSCIPAPHSIYESVKKLEPGRILTLDAAADEPTIEAYWTAAEAVRAGQRDPFEGSADEAVDALERVLGQAVADRLVSDVPLGAFLSGGVDSSTVVSLMQAASDKPVKTFSIGFHADGYNEATDAKRVAEHLGCDHTELYVDPADARRVIPELPTIYDEPFADDSQIPTYLVSRMARRDVTVALSGDGGDELFGGYNRHLWAPRLWQLRQRIPQPVGRLVGGLIGALSPNQWNAVFDAASPLLPPGLRARQPGLKLQKVADALPAADRVELYDRLASRWNQPAEAVRGVGAGQAAAAVAPARHGVDQPGLDAQMDYPAALMYLDTIGYLPDDILTKVDRASMAVSLEARVPMLDHRVVELAWRLPLQTKIRDGQGKWVLRQLLYRHVPRQMVDRPKAGFGMPLGQWLRGPLKDWAADLIAPRRLRREGYFEPAPIERMWREHQLGRRDWQYHLWNVLMFQAWHQAH